MSGICWGELLNRGLIVNTTAKPLGMVGRAGFEPATNWLKASPLKSCKCLVLKAFSTECPPIDFRFKRTQVPDFPRVARFYWGIAPHPHAAGRAPE